MGVGIEFAEHSTRWGVALPIKDSVRPVAHSKACIDAVDNFIIVFGYCGSDIIDRFGEAYNRVPVNYAEQAGSA